MEISVPAIILFCIIFVFSMWAYVKITQYKIKYGNPKKIEELVSKMQKYEKIINMMDQEALKDLEKKVGSLEASIRNYHVSRFTGR